MKRIITAVAALTLAISITDSPTAEAGNYGYVKKTYEVQVEYWFFDTDYYYWSTVFSTSDAADAQFVYNALLDAKAHGNLNTAAPSTYWRYFAVDVRLITKYKYVFPSTRYNATQNYSRSVYQSP